MKPRRLNIASLERAVDEARASIGGADPDSFGKLEADNDLARESIDTAREMRGIIRALLRCPGIDETDQRTGKTFREIIKRVKL